jgi:MoaA/NifB/PqqE/SkfB family radical SAM enzyme
MPDRVVVNLSWKCNLGNCPYCWLKYIAQSESVLQVTSDRSADEWVEALNRLDPAILDFAGGEPLIFPGFIDLLTQLDPKHRYAITTNLHGEALRDILRIPTGNCVHVTASYQPTGRLDPDEFMFRLDTLRLKGISCSINLVNHESFPNVQDVAQLFRSKGFTVSVSPYEHPPNLEVPNDVTFLCQAGIRHYFLNSNGDVYPCCSWFRYSGREQRNMGNIFNGSFRKYSTPQTCRLRCEMYYLEPHGKDMIPELQIRNIKEL